MGQAPGIVPTPTGSAPRMRLDRWLWAARFYKTRERASDAIEAGQVRIGGEKVKPARAIRPGDVITIRRAGLVWAIEVIAAIERRVGAAEAAKAWREDAAITAARDAEIAMRRAAAHPGPAGRPTKRDRRALDDFLNEP